jgi:hypothetical protein
MGTIRIDDDIHIRLRKACDGADMKGSMTSFANIAIAEKLDYVEGLEKEAAK